MRPMRQQKAAASGSKALRLVKIWLPAQLVREMDESILATGGAYDGRDDFIREAVADRIADERMRPAGGPAPLVLLPRRDVRGLEKIPRPERAIEHPSSALLGEVAGRLPERVSTLPAHRVGRTLYGLHNRDYPTLWAALSLLKMAGEKSEQLRWREFLAAILDAAWKVGAHLAKLDTERGSEELKTAIGFPTNPDKRQSSEARFVEHMLGVADREGGPRGPLFALQLAGTKQADMDFLVAPTEEARLVLPRLISAGFAASVAPPHPEAAWRVFRDHLRMSLAEDYFAWIRVLRPLAERPTRDELVRHFTDEWPGAAAATNVAGYVSRGREWGLVESKLIEARYALTELGKRELAAVIK